MASRLSTSLREYCCSSSKWLFRRSPPGIGGGDRLATNSVPDTKDDLRSPPFGSGGQLNGQDGLVIRATRWWRQPTIAARHLSFHNVPLPLGASAWAPGADDRVCGLIAFPGKDWGQRWVCCMPRRLTWPMSNNPSSTPYSYMPTSPLMRRGIQYLHYQISASIVVSGPRGLNR